MAKKAPTKKTAPPREPQKPAPDPGRTTIDSLTPDPSNANRGTERGGGVLENSLRKFGAGRSILIDKNGVVIAGNKTLENAASVGITSVRVIETTGNELVAVKRMDLDINSPAGRGLAIADNRSGELSLDWDVATLVQQAKEFELDLPELGISDNELAQMVKDAGQDEGDGAGAGSNQLPPERWMVVVDCSGEADQVAFLERMAAEGRECKALMS